MFNRNRRGRPKDSPTVVMAAAQLLVDDGKKEAAHNALFETLSYRHRAQFDQTFEVAMKMYIDIGVSILKSCKEGFLHFRSLVQQNHHQSLERMINHIVLCVRAVGRVEIAKIGADSEEQFSSRTLKYQWDCFQTVLMILRNNGKLNHVYMDVIRKGIEFCQELGRTKELKKLCDTVRRRFGYVVHNQTYDYALKINSSETLNAMFSTRLSLLEAALSMGMHQESFKTIKAIQKNLIDRSLDIKKNMDALLYSSFYEKLAAVFWSCNRFMLHSYALFEAYKKLKAFISGKLSSKKKVKEREEKEVRLHRLLHDALLSILVVPAASVNDKNDNNNNNNLSSANNRYYTHSLFQLANDFFGMGNRRQVKPSKSGLLKEVMAEVESELDAAQSESAVALHRLMGVSDSDSAHFSPLTFTSEVSAVLKQFEEQHGANVSFYRAKVLQMGVVQLLQQLSLCFKSISWARFKQLSFGEEQLTDLQLERIITYSVYYGSVSCRICHATRMVTFNAESVDMDRCSELVELNRQLVRLKKRRLENAAEDGEQRHNVFAQIRTQIPSEHLRVSRRLNLIQQQRVNEKRLKQQQQRQKAVETAQAEQKKEREKQIEIRKVTESKKDIEANEEKEQKTKEKQAKLQMKWKELLDNKEKSPKKKKNKGPKGKGKKNAWNRPGQEQSAAHNISKLEDKTNALKTKLQQRLNQPSHSNVEEIERDMERLERIEKRKKRKLLQFERSVFDHFCRAQRRYLAQSVSKEIDAANKRDVPQKKKLWKAMNKENKATHVLRVETRDRLRDIRLRHMARFSENVRKQSEAQQELKQSQQQQQKEAKLKQQKQAKQVAKQQKQKQQQQAKERKAQQQQQQQAKEKAKQTKSPSPSPSNNNARNKGKKKKYAPPKAVPSDSPSKSQSNGNAPQTFAEKMRARRQGGQGDSGGSSFADRIGLGQSGDGQGFGGGGGGGRFGGGGGGDRFGGGDIPRPRFNDNANSNGHDASLRPGRSQNSSK